MKIESLIHMLPTLRDEDCIVAFSDGDSYCVGDLDIQGFFEDDFEIYAPFSHCLTDSVAKRQALDAGRLRIPRISWTSVEPSMPVGKTYLIQEIQSIFNRSANYEIYQKHA